MTVHQGWKVSGAFGEMGSDLLMQSPELHQRWECPGSPRGGFGFHILIQVTAFGDSPGWGRSKASHSVMVSLPEVHGESLVPRSPRLEDRKRLLPRLCFSLCQSPGRP